MRKPTVHVEPAFTIVYLVMHRSPIGDRLVDGWMSEATALRMAAKYNERVANEYFVQKLVAFELTES